mgnify:CR=1 FL=1
MFELVGTKDITVQHATGSIIVGELNKSPYWSKRSKRGTRAIWARDLRTFLTFVRDQYSTARHVKRSDAPKEKRDDFFTFNSFDEAMHTFIREPHTIRKFKAKEDDILIPDNLGQDVQFDVTGDYIDMGRFMEGDPEHFGNMHMGNPNNVFATIMLNISAPGHLQTGVLERRAQRVLRLVDWLESQQIRTQVVAVKANECTYLELTLKQFQDSINLDSMAVVCHNDFLRRVLFRVAEYSSTYTWSYGLAAMVNNGLMKLPINRDSNILVLSEAQATIDETDALFDKTERTIEKNLTEGEQRFNILT